MASKYEDRMPLRSNHVSEKIAHNRVSAREIVKKEAEFLMMFDFEIDFVTHYDFFETYVDKVERALVMGLSKANGRMIKLVKEISMHLVKMSIKKVNFCKYSPSIVVMSSLYAATDLIYNSKLSQDPETFKFCAQT